MIKKIVVLGKEFELNTPISEDDVKTKWRLIVSELNPALIEQIDEEKVGVRIEGEIFIVFRIDAIFG